MAKVFITRIGAISILNSILERADLTEEERTGIEDIIHCIDVEREYYHEWGGLGEEVVYLHMPRASKPVEAVEREELARIYKKYRFRPSGSDLQESENQINDIKKMLFDKGYLGENL